jgi:hypothetical protein
VVQQAKNGSSDEKWFERRRVVKSPYFFLKLLQKIPTKRKTAKNGSGGEKWF